MHLVLRERHPVLAIGAGAAGVLVITVALSPLHEDVTHASPALLLVIPVVAAGVVGGRVASAVVAGCAGLAFATGFLEPIGSPRVDRGYDLVALVVFLVVANLVGELTAGLVEVQHRRAANDAARIEALERIDRQRSALLRSVSHDLRTPLATIQAVVTDLASGSAWDEDTRRSMLELVWDEAERLDRLVANLLSMSRVEAGAFAPNRQALDVVDLVTTCVLRLRRLLRDVPLVVEVADDLPLLDGDPSQLDQVVTNLIENAVRYSPPGCAVEVVAELVAGFVRVAVGDAGPGIAIDRRGDVFEPFGGVEGHGTGGLGLALCRSIVEAHGGTISVDESRAGGAEVSFTLPVRVGATGTPANQATP